MKKFMSNNGLVFFIIIFLAITDFVVTQNYLFLCQIFGFVFLTLIPGYLILKLFNISNIDTTKIFLLSVGLSISILIFIGIFLNTIFSLFGIKFPLSTVPILISFNILILSLIVLNIIFIKNCEIKRTMFSFKVIDKTLLIFCFFLLSISLLAVQYLNLYSNNFLLILFFILVSIFIIIFSIINNKITEDFYPIYIYIISISLILIYPLRSSYIIGIDSHSEYFFFQTTFINHSWEIINYTLLDSCLSITIIPTIFESILQINSQILFKFLYPILFSISPLIVYIISNNFISRNYAFFASFFFMSQMTFLISSAQSRTVIAILFFGLSLMVLCSKEIEYSKIKLLIIIFSIIIIFSHYSTSYIHLVLYVGVALLSYFIKNNQKYHSPITIATILFLFTFMYFWFSIITKGAFNGAISVLNNVFIIDTFLSENTRAPELVQLLGKNLQDPIISGLNLIIQWLVLICIYTGILILFLFLIKKQIVPKFFFDRLPDFNYSAFYREFIILGFCCGIILAIVVILPNISKSFDIARTFTILSVITSCFFVIGAIFYSNLFREILIYNKILTPKYFVSVIIVFIVTLNFLFNAGIPHQLVGHRDTIIFNSEGEYYNQTIVHDQDHYGSIWLKSKMDNNNGITTDQMGKIILMSQALINQTTQFSELLVNSNQQNYIFFTHYMTNNKKFLNQWRESYQDIKTYDRIIEMNNKIYSTKSTEIWFKTM